MLVDKTIFFALFCLHQAGIGYTGIMNNIKLVEQFEKVITKTYKLEIDGTIYHWLDYVDRKGKVIDSTFHDDYGNEVSMDNPDLAQQVEDFIDSLQE